MTTQHTTAEVIAQVAHEQATQKATAQNGMYALFMACALGGGLAVMALTPPALLAPTLWIGGLLFFGLGALIDRVGAAVNVLTRAKTQNAGATPCGSQAAA